MNQAWLFLGFFYLLILIEIMGGFNNEDRLKIRQLENELKEVKKELDQLKAGGGAVGNDQMVKRLAELEMDNRARRFFNTVTPPNSDRKIVLQNGHKYSPDIGAFMRNGASYCRALAIQRGPNDSAFADQPPDFFDNLIKHFHETENPDEIVASLDIALALNNPAPWPAVLVRLHGAALGLISKEQLEKDGVPTLAEVKVDHGEKVVEYTMSNKHKPEARFKLRIYFEGEAKCHQHMTRFAACRTDIITFSVPGSEFEHEVETERKLQELNAKNEKMGKEMGKLKDELNEVKFLRYGGAHCHAFYICRRISDGFGYPPNFFNDLIKYYYETKVLAKAVNQVNIDLPWANPAPWPTALVQPQAGEMNVEELEVHNVEKYATYIFRNKHNPGIAFRVFIFFEGNTKCYQQMTAFEVHMWDVQSGEA